MLNIFTNPVKSYIKCVRELSVSVSLYDISVYQNPYMVYSCWSYILLNKMNNLHRIKRFFANTIANKTYVVTCNLYFPSLQSFQIHSIQAICEMDLGCVRKRDPCCHTIVCCDMYPGELSKRRWDIYRIQICRLTFSNQQDIETITWYWYYDK